MNILTDIFILINQIEFKFQIKSNKLTDINFINEITSFVIFRT